MADLKNAKILGGIGSILMLIGAFIPMVGGIVPLIGLILVIVGVYYIGEVTKDGSIFKNYLLSFILQIVAVVALFVIIIITIGATIGFSPMAFYDLAQSEAGVTDPTTVFGNIGALIGSCCLAIIVFWILMIVSSMFLRKSFKSISEHTNVGLFGTAGTVYLVGAGLLIIGVGAIVILIAIILQIVAFFQLPDALPTRSNPDSGKQDTGRKCPNCGRPIPMDSQVCPYCGKDFRPPAPKE